MKKLEALLILAVSGWVGSTLLTPEEMATLRDIENQLSISSLETALMGPQEGGPSSSAGLGDPYKCSCDPNSCRCCATHPDATDALHCVGIGVDRGNLSVIATIADYIHYNTSHDLNPNEVSVKTAESCAVVTPKKLTPWVKLEICTEVNITQTNGTHDVCVEKAFYLWGLIAAVMSWQCFEVKMDFDSGSRLADDAVPRIDTKREMDVVNFSRKAPMVAFSRAFKEWRSRSIENKTSLEDSLPKGNTSVRINWEPLAEGEIPYLAVLYRLRARRAVHIRGWSKSPFSKVDEMLSYAANDWFFDGQEPDLVDPVSGQDCGGTLITANTILTLCFCVRPLQKNPQQSDVRSPEIYVAFGSIHAPFTADYRYKLEIDPGNVESFCQRESELNPRPDAFQRGTWVVVPITPKVLDLQPAVFRHLSQSYNPYEASQSSAILAGFGLILREPANLFDDRGNLFIPKDHAEKVFLRRECSEDSCDGPNSICEVLKKNRGLKCFSAENVQLCGGLPGFPVIIDGKLVGISTTPLDCRDGTVFVQWLGGNSNNEFRKPVIAQPVKPKRKPDPKPVLPTEADDDDDDDDESPGTVIKEVPPRKNRNRMGPVRRQLERHSIREKPRNGRLSLKLPHPISAFILPICRLFGASP